MIWVGNFKSLHSVLSKPRFTEDALEVHTWLRSEIALISPFTDWLMNLIARSSCVRGKEELVELALREAMNNAILHGNRMDARKLVHAAATTPRVCSSSSGIKDMDSNPVVSLTLWPSKTWMPNTDAVST